MISDEDLEKRLTRLGRATDGIRATPGFSARVLAALPAEPRPWLALVSISSRRFLSIAAVTAVVAVTWAVRAESSMDDALAISYGALDVDGD